jgi:hypothetical protein
MWIVEQRDPGGSWLTRGTFHEQEDAEYFARLYKAHNPGRRFRYRRTDVAGDPDADSEPIEV